MSKLYKFLIKFFNFQNFNLLNICLRENEKKLKDFEAKLFKTKIKKSI